MNSRIRKIRRELDLTQTEFAGKIGTTANVLTNYETGRRNPSSSVINNICKTFNVNEEWLRNGVGEIFKASLSNALDELANQYGLSHGDYILIEKFVNMKAEKRAAVVDYVLQVAAAMQEEEMEPTVSAIIQNPLEPQTTTKEEKMTAYQEYLNEKEKAVENESASNS